MPFGDADSVLQYMMSTFEFRSYGYDLMRIGPDSFMHLSLPTFECPLGD